MTFDEELKGVYLDHELNREHFIYSDGFYGHCFVCGKLTRWRYVIYNKYVCSRSCLVDGERSKKLNFELDV